MHVPKISSHYSLENDLKVEYEFSWERWILLTQLSNSLNHNNAAKVWMKKIEKSKTEEEGIKRHWRNKNVLLKTHTGHSCKMVKYKGSMREFWFIRGQYWNDKTELSN